MESNPPSSLPATSLIPPSPPVATTVPVCAKYLDNPHNVAHFTVDPPPLSTGDLSSLLPSLQALLAEVVCGEEISAPPTAITAGLSNELLLVPCRSGRKFLIRIQPECDDAEHAIAAHLSSVGCGPTYFGRFANGRVEEFYDGTTTLVPADLCGRRYRRRVAEAMGGFHVLLFPAAAMGPPGTGERIWDRVEAWLGRAATGGDVLSVVRAAWADVRSGLWEPPELPPGPAADAVAFARGVVPCHMDMQSLNILRRVDGDGEGPVHLIDFEYAGYNRRAVDLANTFCECCDMNNLRPDYAREYPETAARTRFLSDYLAVADPDRRWQPSRNGGPLHDGDDDPAYGDAFLCALTEDVERHTLVSHVAWAAWALCKCGDDKNGVEDFDYVKYARIRMEGYEWASGRLRAGRN